MLANHVYMRETNACMVCAMPFQKSKRINQLFIKVYQINDFAVFKYDKLIYSVKRVLLKNQGFSFVLSGKE